MKMLKNVWIIFIALIALCLLMVYDVNLTAIIISLIVAATIIAVAQLIWK